MIKFIKQVANLWRMRKNPTAYEKGLLRHLSIKPSVRDEVGKFHAISFNDFARLCALRNSKVKK